MKKGLILLVALATLLVTPRFAAAANGTINWTDSLFVLIASAMVLLMTPGLAFFYGGMVRRRNVLSTMMHSFLQMGLITVLWILIGYTLAFGPDLGHMIGSLKNIGLAGVGSAARDGTSIPELLFMVFQGMFAIITVGLISGAWAERIKFSAFFLFSGLWLVLVYAPICHWVWGGGWLGADGALDFAGGTVVHISSAVSALAGVLLLGPRRGFPREAMLPHNVPFTALGAGLLWFGWFGFNAGSALAVNDQAVLAFVTTHAAAAAALMSWLLLDWYRHGKPNVLGAVSGAVAGLVVITPAAGFVTVSGALILGLLAGIICNYAVHFRIKMGLDDSLDVLGIHGVGGTLGAILTAVFCSSEYLVDGSRSLQLWAQVKGVLATYIYAFVVSYLILLVLKKTIGLRVNKDEEAEGLDVTQHGEVGYNL